MDNEGVPGRAPRPDQLLEEASLWFARMRGPDAEEFRPGFERWLSLGSEHLGAYNRAGEVFALGKFLAETPDRQSIAERNQLGPPIRWRVTAIAASLFLLIGLGAWFARGIILAPALQTVPVVNGTQRHSGDLLRFSTEKGERRELMLADGSKVTLEAASLLTASIGAERRELKLWRGRARFEVAHEKRPFVVFAGGGSVTARGTIFDVIIDDDHGVTVHLVRGAVDVERARRERADPNAKAIVTRLEPGETLNFGVARTSLAQTMLTGPALDTPVRPIGDAVEFEKASLSQIIERANRGAGISIRLADPAIGDLKVSGRFRIDDPEQLAERLASLFNLKTERGGDQEILLRSK